MAGVTDCVFRQLCKELGADLMVTEFVSAEGILQRDDRTRKYTEFTDAQRPLGVQLFGADGQRLGEAARRIIDWKRPDFIDLNFGCPVNKVVAKNGGSSLLKDLSLLAAVAGGVVKAVGHLVPVTAKIRTGWDARSINAPEVCRLLEDAGIAALTVHGRTRAQGYSGTADWQVIDACARAVRIPVIGNGDISSGADVARRRAETAVAGVMIGRAAMGHPWVFREAKEFLASGRQPAPVPFADRWAFIVRHCRLAAESPRYGSDERHAITSMRARLMAYCKGFPGAKDLRQRLCHVASVAAIEDLAASALSEVHEMPPHAPPTASGT